MNRHARRKLQHSKEGRKVADQMFKGFKEQVDENLKRNQRYKPIQQLMQSLPADGKWTVDEREKWFEALRATLDMVTTLEHERSI